MKLLIVEDDKKTAAFIIKGFRELRFAVDHAEDGRIGALLAQQNDYDAIIVDLMLPILDGLSLIKNIRIVKPDVKIIILSAKHSLDEKVEGLEIGADDYLTKPFAFAELCARINALLRRNSFQANPMILSAGGLEVSITSRKVKRDGIAIELQPREFALLEYFMRNPNRVITRTMILEHIWDISFDPATNIVDVLVCRLRDKIDRDFKSPRIHTVRGIGYVFKDKS